ncbi:MAG: exodeoxyribonuclease III [Pyrinomonadaceae bacterium]
MKIATWNVNSIIARLPVVLRWLDETRPDVLCLQETKCIDDKFPHEEFKSRGYRIECYGQPAYNGVAIASLHQLTDVGRGFSCAPDTGRVNEQQARLICATVGGLRVVNIYVPNGSSVGSEKYLFKLEWLEKLREFFDQTCDPGKGVLVCGDFNIAPEDKDVYDPKAWEGQILCSEPERAALRRIEDWGFEDAFRINTLVGGQYTWWDYRAGAFQRNNGLRIDLILVTEPLTENCSSVWIDKQTREWERPSDHAPVIAEFDL